MTHIIKLLSILLTAYTFVEGTIHIVGDSHIGAFSCIEDCVFHWMGPRTMHRFSHDGLACVNLRSLNVQDNDFVVFVFGEIDVRCHIGKQRDISKRSLQEILYTLVSNYIEAIKINRNLFENIQCGVFAIVPPTNTIFYDKFPTYGTIEDRVMITQSLNNTLHELCQNNKIFVIDVYNDYANTKGTLDSSLSDGNVHIGRCNNTPVRDALSKIVGKPLATVPYIHYFK